MYNGYFGNIIDIISDQASWEAFFDYKKDNQHLSKYEEASIRNFITQKRYLPLCDNIRDNSFPGENPVKLLVNKQGATKKRIVYSFSQDVNFMLKFIAHQLYKYDDHFENSCYAFRKNYGVGNAFTRIRSLHNSRNLSSKYCLKVDISNYFNSIDVEILLNKLSFVDDPVILNIFKAILTNDVVLYNNVPVSDNHGAMAGLPISPFCANVYLSETDKLFNDMNVIYFRYSDDILLFADTMDELLKYQDILYSNLTTLKLSVNPDKEHIYQPGEVWEFLGFSFDNGIIDLSENTKKKIKAKIKRKANALMRWQRKKKLPRERAAIGFINSMNRKFFGTDEDDEFTWSRWFFPILNTEKGLAEIDHYMQQYIRYIITGRHYKGNYRIRYEQIKKWGYRSLVNEYYK